MNRLLWIEMQDVLETVRQDNNVKVLIVTGLGRAFSTGGGQGQKRYDKTNRMIILCHF